MSWKSSKQETVTDSTTEAEYIAASEAAKEAVWIRKFVSELGVVPSASSPVDLYYDNSGAIAQAKEPRSHQKSKHVLQRYHLIREIIDRGDVKICKVHTDFNWCHPYSFPNNFVPDSILLVCPQNHRNIRISATLNCWTCRLFVGQHSAPYNIAGRIAVL